MGICHRVALMLALLGYAASVDLKAQTLKYPPGYSVHSYESGWIKGSTQAIQCAARVAEHHPGAEWSIVSSSEVGKWGNKHLRTDRRYNYFCTLLIKDR